MSVRRGRWENCVINIFSEITKRASFKNKNCPNGQQTLKAADWPADNIK